MAENPIRKEICRCCHTEGVFKSLSTPYSYNSKEEIYSNMLAETFDINLTVTQGNLELTSTICDTCIMRLRDAVLFKTQVLDCEQMLEKLYNKHVFKAFELCVVKEEYDTSCDVKLEPRDFDDQLPSDWNIPENQELIPQHCKEDFVMPEPGNLNNVNTMKMHVHRSCSQPDKFGQTNSPKTAAERMREYRYRMRQKRQQTNVNLPKTAAERMREYRARKKSKNDTTNNESTINPIEMVEAIHETEFSSSSSEFFNLSYVSRPKTALERVREYRARKKMYTIKKRPKTAKERAREYRARKKSLAQSKESIHEG